MGHDPEDAAPFHLDDSSMEATVEAVREVRPPRVGQGSAGWLRRELNERAVRFAAAHGLPYESTAGAAASVLFAPHETVGEAARHGNFFEASYRAIVAEPGWAVRLGKAHTGHRRARARADWRWSELDAAVSSDALLMNIFCCPGVLEDARVRALLGIGPEVRAEFGYRPRIPLANGRFDRTEVDLRLGHLLLEAKLTEGSFQPARPALLHRYRDLDRAFDAAGLEGTPVAGYQLMRGVLAALAEPVVPAGSFCVLADRRRPDLIEAWYAVVQRVRGQELRCRLQMLTWQELAAVLPPLLQQFLREKYGIVP